jgi:nucleoside-diphosphate-sugar epimerase
MKARDARVLITGGAGGIGSAVARELLGRGSAVLLVDRDPAALQRAAHTMAGFGDRVATHRADLVDAADR